MKQKLKELLKEKELTLPEIYLALSDFKKSSIRATLNNDIKKGNTFIRVSKGKYKLKEKDEN